ncbi:MAG: hypothetical protein IPK74_05345 [Deltaproteobacteria bacterium]|nr:hypothetical protein [Deltaproteobacteria bacterium]
MHPSGTLVAPRPRSLLRRALVVLGATTLLAGGVALFVWKPWHVPVPVTAARIDAELELAAGEVLLVAGDGPGERLLSKTPLGQDARLRTGEGARALVRLSDGTRAFLDEQTEVVIGRGVTIVKGRVWIDAPPLDRGEDATVHALGDATLTLAEGGASLQLQDGAREIYVASGTAVVTATGGRREIAAGERASIDDAGAPQVAPVAFWEDWTGGMGDRSALGRTQSVGQGALFAVDRQAAAGAPALPLSIQRQTVKVALVDALAETLVDQRFFNPNNRAVEGWYWFTIPEGAQLVGFALETNGQLVEGEIVERHDAARKYEAAVQRDNDPALLEWIDEHTVRARIFPVPALGTRRIVVRYQQLLRESEGKLRYAYPLAGPPGKHSPTIEEFALQVELGELAKRYEVSTLGEARVEGDGARVTMRRSGYQPRADFQLELSRKPGVEFDTMRLALLDPGGDQGRYAMLRWAPDLDLAHAAVPPGEVVVVVDTSAAGDSSEYLARVAAAEALLRSLSAGDRFAVMSADLQAEVLFPDEGMSEATDEAIDTALERLARHATGGATDLGAIFDAALERVHGLEQPAIVYIGDGLATSGERRGEALIDRVRRTMAGSRARLFTIGVGRQIDAPVLDRLAEVGGGQSLRVESNELAVARALELSGALKTPILTDLVIELGEGLDDVFTNTNGKLARGQELVLLARTHHDLPKSIRVTGRLAGEAFDKSYDVTNDTGTIVQAVPKLWAAAHIDHLRTDSRGLDAVRGQILSLGLEYGLLSPFTSYLALDSEAAYAQMGVQRRNRRFGGVRLVADASIVHGDGPSTRGAGLLQGFVGAMTAPLGCDAKRESAGASKNDDAPSPVAASAPPPPVPGSPGPTTPEPAQTELAAEEVAPAADAPAAKLADSRAAEKDGTGDEPPGAVPGGVPGGRPTGTTPATVRPAPAKAVDDDEPRDLAETRKVEAVRSSIARHRSEACSDAAAQDLAQRKVLWQRRLALTSDVSAALELYEATAATCELPGWKDQRTLLTMIAARAGSEHDVSLLLSHFEGDADARNYLARALLRRMIDPALVAAVNAAMSGVAIDWPAMDRRLRLATSHAERLTLLRAALSRAPGDPEGERRMLTVLAANGQRDEAIARGRKLREQGWFTPALAQTLGELLVDAGQVDDAQRVLSEIVEFDPESIDNRRLLGDIFLRHGWFDGAYEQYDDLAQLVPDDAAVAIRLARAAAGTGRIDEALRILRKLAADEGRPGADDPRRFARLHAAAYLARMMADTGTPKASIAAELRRLQLFDAPTTWTLLTWHDLDARLVLAREDDVQVDALAAGDTGLFALQTSGAKVPIVVRHAGADHGRMVAYDRVVIAFDGRNFEVTVEPGNIGPAAATPDEPKPATPTR